MYCLNTSERKIRPRAFVDMKPNRRFELLLKLIIQYVREAEGFDASLFGNQK